MCIIVFKEKNVSAKLDWDILKTCFENNPDGAGYAISYNNSLILRKGFMSYKSFQDSFKQATKKINLKDSAILLHFRITTHGGTRPENTHPFPIGAPDITNKKYSNIPACVAMNGITFSNGGKTTTVSDTMEVVNNIINPFYNISGSFWKNKSAKPIFDWLGAKWAILDKTGDITAFGEFHKNKGWYYSNYSYLNYSRYYKNDKLYSFNDCYISTVNNDYSPSWYDLEEYTGKVMDIITGNEYIVNIENDYFIDYNNDIYMYDWENDSFELLENIVPVIGGDENVL